MICPAVLLVFLLLVLDLRKIDANCPDSISFLEYGKVFDFTALFWTPGCCGMDFGSSGDLSIIIVDKDTFSFSD